MSLVPVYIAAPFTARNEGLIEENVSRAVYLAKLATERGYAPIVVHPAIERGAYGEDGVVADRARGIAICCSIVSIVGRHPEGELWVLRQPDDGLSEGVVEEIRAFRDALLVEKKAAKFDGRKWDGDRTRMRLGTWREWVRHRPLDNPARAWEV